MVVERVVRGEGGQVEEWGRQVELLLRLAPFCEGLLSFISHDCLQIGWLALNIWTSSSSALCI